MIAKHRALSLAVAMTLAGCGKTDKRDGSNQATGGMGSGATNASAGASSRAGTGGGGGAGAPLSCNEDGPRPGPSPLTRLDNQELNNSVRAMLPEQASVGDTWLPEDNHERVTDRPSAPTVEGLAALARAVAQQLTNESPQGFLQGCDVATKGEAACRKALAEPLLERIYRRPLSDEDRQELVEVFDMGRDLGGDFASGMRAVIEVALQSPDFVYLVERGNGNVVGNAVELTGFESAARLAYFLTAAPPDAELLGEAAQGPLSEEQLAQHAQRLLTSASSRAALSRFYNHSLSLDVPRPNEQSGLTQALAQDATEASQRFIDDALFGTGTFRALLTEPSTWANGALASFYGYQVKGSNWQKVSLDPTRSSGLFTQPGFLAMTSHGDNTSAVQRGLHILRKVLCYQSPDPPADVAISLPEPAAAATERERLEVATSSPACNDCHRHINPVGFALGHYDAVGKWRDLDGGMPVDASGVLDITDAAGPFTDASSLMQNIVDSGDARSCFVRFWLERAQRREWSEETDACSAADAAQHFAAGDGEVAQLLVDISRTDNLRYRLKAELP